ncbi:hypothetical protein K438DRAFT_2086607 [Mycena galopus ATCC 62051]|nr:hypothetical protein K438DRAFT_2086607 [Mycena galopus ATCC 62051]
MPSYKAARNWARRSTCLPAISSSQYKKFANSNSAQLSKGEKSSTARSFHRGGVVRRTERKNLYHPRSDDTQYWSLAILVVLLALEAVMAAGRALEIQGCLHAEDLAGGYQVAVSLEEVGDLHGAGAMKAAGIELGKEVKDLASDLTANHPLPNNKKKMLRPRPEQAVGPEDYSGFAPAVAKGDAPDEYQLPHDQENEEDEVLDPSDNDTGAAPAKATPKKDKKGCARLEVQISVEAQHAFLASSRVAGKRKQAPESEQVIQLSACSVDDLNEERQAQGLGGLRDEFKWGQSPSLSKASNRSKSAGSAMSVDQYDTQYTDGDKDIVMPPQSDYNDSSEGIGGFDSEFESLAGIVDTTTPGLVPLKAKLGIKKKEISLDNLPLDICSQFNSHFKPQFLRLLEPVAPWTGIESWMDITSTWDAVFPKYQLHKNQVLQAVVVKLERKLGRWHHDFASTCIDSLGQLLTSWGQETATRLARRENTNYFPIPKHYNQGITCIPSQQGSMPMSRQMTRRQQHVAKESRVH